MRSPEISLAIIAAFLISSPSTLSTLPLLQTKFLPAVLISCKSVSPTTRAASVRLFDVLFTELATEADLLPIAEQVSAPLKAGKTVSPDHRTTLFTMLGSLLPTAKVSAEVINITLTLLPKETNDITIAAMMRVITRHLRTYLTANIILEAGQILALVKGMQEPKPSVRRPVCLAIGAVIWSLDGDASIVNDAIKSFAVGILPALESGLKTVTTNPLNAPAGPLEGFIAVALLKGRMARWDIAAIGSSSSISFTMNFD